MDEFDPHEIADRHLPQLVALHGGWPTYEQSVAYLTQLQFLNDDEIEQVAQVIARRNPNQTDTKEPQPMTSRNQAAIENLALEITPGLVEEHGNRPDAQCRAAFVGTWLNDRGIDLDDTDFESLMDEVKDLAPTYTLTAS